MLRNVESSWRDCFDIEDPDTSKWLRSYFGRVRNGNWDEVRTPFYGEKDSFGNVRSAQSVLLQWMPTLEKLADRWPSLYEFENDLAAKVGPLSFMKPLSERLDDVDSYYSGILLPQSAISQSAIAAVTKEWNHVAGMMIRDQNLTVENMKKSTTSGSPFCRKRRNVVSDTIPCKVFQDNLRTFQTLNGKNWEASAILGWRGQEGGPNPEDVKQRVVWMFPFAVNIQELQVYQPLIEAAQRYNLVPAWVSMDAVDKSITQLFDTKGKQDDIICTDFTKFDQHFGPACQDAAKIILGNILDRGTSQAWLRDVFPIKYNIPLALDIDWIRSGPHGMGSGSGGTNFDETIVHRALQYEAALLAKTILNPFSMCLGDDGILTFPGITIEMVTDAYSKHGLVMNPSKQSISKDDCTYLRRWHHTDYRKDGVCVGVYSTARAIGRLCEQERYFPGKVWGTKMVALRQLSIIENVKWHPLRDEFVDFCMAGDKYRLGIDIPGFLDNIESIAQEAIDHMPDFLGYTKSQQQETGISDWWIVKHLKSIA